MAGPNQEIGWMELKRILGNLIKFAKKIIDFSCLTFC